MLTDDEKRELIAEAIAKSDDVNHEGLCGCGHWPDWCSTYDTQRPWRHDAEFVAAEALSLADALEGTLTEPEWEWALKNNEDTDPWSLYYGSRESLEGNLAALADRDDETLVRRRKAGPWEVAKAAAEAIERLPSRDEIADAMIAVNPDYESFRVTEAEREAYLRDADAVLALIREHYKEEQ